MYLPPHFHYRKNKLYVEEISVEEIAETHGTPSYVYSRAAIEENLALFHESLQRVPHLICYAVKANPNLSILRLLGKLGAGADIVSGGEMQRALAAGISPRRIVFAGVGKTRNEIREALRAGVLHLNAESEQELRIINEEAGKLRVKAPVSLRVNPDIDAKTHPYISTGLKKHKFGIAMRDAIRHFELCANLPHIEANGIHVHLGSQINDVEPFKASLLKILDLAQKLRRRLNLEIRYIDLGGGIAIRYRSASESVKIKEFARIIVPLVLASGMTLLLEPGRSIVGNAGILLARVLYTKNKFVIVDAGMNDFIRPALYDAYHEVVPVHKTSSRKAKVDIVGPVCETGDFFARNRPLQPVKPDDLLAILGTGAYGMSMSSNYNSRPRAAEIMISGSTMNVIRSRETLEDLYRHEE